MLDGISLKKWITNYENSDFFSPAAKAVHPVLTDETILISDLIIADSVNIIGRRSGGKAGEQLYNYFIDNCDLVFADEKILKGSISVFLRYDGTLSVSDSASVFIMKKKTSNGSFHLIQILIKLQESSGYMSPDGEYLHAIPCKQSIFIF